MPHIDDTPDQEEEQDPSAPEATFQSVLDSLATTPEEEEPPEADEKEELPAEPGPPEEEQYQIPPLDPSIVDLIPEEAKERWNQQWEGLLKREEQLKADAKAYDVFESYNRAFNDPNTWEDAYKFLGDQLRTAFGHSARPAETQASPTAPLDTTGWKEKGYASETECRLDLELQALKTQVLADQQARSAELAKAKEQAAFNQYVDAQHPRVARAIEKEHLGFKVTKEMLRQAITDFPQLKEDPRAAIEAKYSRALMKHYAESAAKGTKRVRDMAPSQSPKPVTLPKDLSKLTFAQVQEMMRSSEA